MLLRATLATPVPTSGSRIVLWGDSIANEAREAFTSTARADGADALTRTLGGTAICDWFGAMERQLREWTPTIAILSFSGNSGTTCMHDRDPTAAYGQDAERAIRRFSAAGVTVDLVESPTRRNEPVDRQKRTTLARL
jgi:hypothetical protein